MSVDKMNSQEIINLYQSKYGIHFSNMTPIVADSDISFQKKALTMDADTYAYNPASSGVPAWYTLVNLNKVVSQLLIKRAYMQIGDPLQQGVFNSNIMSYATVGLSGEVEDYGDFVANARSDNNYTFPTRDVFRGQTIIQYGELEVDTLSAAKIDAISQKHYSAAMTIAIAQNKMFFYGNVNSTGAFINHNFGLLNDPSLNSSTPATNGTGSSPLWSDKSARGASQDIVNDVVVTAFNVMQEQMGGNIELTNRFKLCLSTTASAYLNTTNQFGLNPAELIKKVMPNIEFVYAPEYKTIGSFQLIAVDAIQENMVKDLFTYKTRAHNLIPGMSSYRQKWSFGSAGCGILNYAPIVTISGIE